MSVLIAYSGVHNYKPQPKASWIQRMSSDNVLDIDTLNSMKIAAQVAGIVLITVLAAIAAAVGGLVCWYVASHVEDRYHPAGCHVHVCVLSAGE